MDTLGAIETVKLKRLPRMADFAQLGVAMCRAMKWEKFSRIYGKSRRAAAIRALESCPTAQAVREFIWKTNRFEGTYKELLSRLERFRIPSEAWVKTPKGLSDALRRQKPVLRQIGITMEELGHTRSGSKVLITMAQSSSRSSRRSQFGAVGTRE